MKVIIRILVVIIVAPVTYCFVYWIPCTMLLHPSSVPRFIANHIVSLICAVIAGWYVWKKPGATDSGLISSIIIGALILGGIGFSAGFFGPMLFSPGANQGPLLGIFLTGPLGVLIGGIAGGIYWAIRHRDARSD